MNNSGIFSLSGFAYQIKVFIYYLSMLEDGYTIGYETYDDIALKKSDTETNKQEDKLNTYNGLLNSSSGITALQIKHTTLNSEDYEKVLFNWILLKNEFSNIDKYVLFVDKTYGNKDSVFPNDLEPLFDKIIKSKKTNAALITKVRNILNNDYILFCNLCAEIQNKYSFQEMENIDDEISKSYKDIFNQGGVIEPNYYLRIKEFVQEIEYAILESVTKNNSYTCDYSTFKHIVENINKRVRDEIYLPPNFSSFKQSSKLDIKNSEIVNSRQYIQLLKCGLPESVIKENLIFEEYYSFYKLRNLENIKLNEISNIENTTHYNFEVTKALLNAKGKDCPYERFDQTLNKENSYTPNTHIKYGSAIHLTKSDTEKDLLIPWEDDR